VENEIDEGSRNRASKKKFVRRDKTALGPRDRLRLLSKLRIWCPIKKTQW